MKTVALTVWITFSGEIEENAENLKELSNNIAESLKHTADTSGLSPQGCDEYVKEIAVSHSGTELTNIKIGI